uniref:Uncharacterized protein n=1 Tax=Anguilla anguilla TaxID=7936 RepID=A0A0E9USB2_ANGAN
MNTNMYCFNMCVCVCVPCHFYAYFIKFYSVMGQ